MKKKLLSIFMSSVCALGFISILVSNIDPANAATNSTSTSSAVEDFQKSNVNVVSPPKVQPNNIDPANAATNSTSTSSAVEDFQKSNVNVVSSPKVQPNNIVTSIAKKIIIQAIRHGGYWLGRITEKLSPKAAHYLEKYSYKIADFLDDLDKWQQYPIIVGLTHIGVPYAEAKQIADVIVFFVGIV